MQTTNWVVITGGPSSGITSLGNYLRLLGFHVVPECARGLIDLGRSCGVTTQALRANQVQFERDIVEIQYEIEKRLDPQKLIFIERGLLDCEAYGMPREEILNRHMFKYQHIYVLEQVGFMEDYARTESKDEATQLEQHIERTYQECGYQPIRIPKQSIMDRAAYILKLLDIEPQVPVGETVNRLLKQFISLDAKSPDVIV